MQITLYVLQSGDGYGHNSVNNATLNKNKADEWARQKNCWVDSFVENIDGLEFFH